MSPNEPARRQTDLAGVKLMLGWVRAAGFDSILATGNDAVETWRVRARCLHAPEAALTFCVLMLLAASQATPGPRVQRISSHTLAHPSRTTHCRSPASASPPQAQPRACEHGRREISTPKENGVAIVQRLECVSTPCHGERSGWTLRGVGWTLRSVG